MIRYFDTPLSATDRSRKKIRRDIEDMSNSISHINLIECSTQQKHVTHFFQDAWNIHKDRSCAGP